MRRTAHLLHALTGGRAQSRALLRYGLAFVSVLAAMAATRFVGSPLVGMPLVVCAVLITASLGGIGPGLLAWLLSFVAIGFSSTPALPFDAEHLPALLLVSAATLLTGWVSTTRRRTEEELRVAQTRFRTFVDQATDAFFLLDEQLAVVDVNRQACESLGWSREELIGMHPRDFDASLDEPSIARLAERADAGETITFETRHRRRGGTVFPVEIRTGMFLQGGRRFYLALARDISDRKRAADALQEKDDALQMARTELARVSRLTTLGELTASIAHEVSQPLGAMVASAAAGANWLAAEPPDIAEARSAFEEIAADGMRARDVIARIRALTKRQALRMELLDINRKVLEVVALTEREVRSHDIVLQTQLDSAVPRVAGDRVQLQQVLLNLVLNAIEAMSGVHDRPRELTIVSAQDRPNAAVTVEVRDSGPGLEPERVERVFEPFYTTKAGGLGIGLSISRSIVEAHGGRLWAGANEPHGAVFRFSLPVSSATTRLV
jgi:PAS domain S-box-containing protein